MGKQDLLGLGRLTYLLLNAECHGKTKPRTCLIPDFIVFDEW